MIIIVLLGLILPRFVIFLLWLFSNWFNDVFDHWLIPILGFFFLPYTLLWYSVVMNWFNGAWGMWQVLILIVAIITDLSSGKKGVRG